MTARFARDRLRLRRAGPGVLGRLWGPWYDLLNRLLADDSLAFMNYGYADAAITAPSDDPLAFYGERLYERITRDLPLDGADLLEVSCGRGGGAAFLARSQRPHRVVGLERSARAVAYCRRRHVIPGLSFVRGDAAALELADRSFDIVINVEASHCYDRLDAFLAEVHRVLRPSGHLALADFRHTAQVATLETRFAAAGFDLVERTDITRAVLRSMAASDRAKRVLVAQHAPRVLQPLFRQFAGVGGSRVQESFARGDRIYLVYDLRKRHA